jgi:hypothetical protein
MRPTTPELLDSIAEQLGEQVLPAVTDKWAASTVRSAIQLLRHLALRVEHEPRLLAAESMDLQLTLKRVAEALSDTELSELKTATQFALTIPAAPANDHAAQCARDAAVQGTVEALVAARDLIRSATGTTDVHDWLLAYLERRLVRERELIIPFQTTPPI